MSVAISMKKKTVNRRLDFSVSPAPKKRWERSTELQSSPSFHMPWDESAPTRRSSTGSRSSSKKRSASIAWTSPSKFVSPQRQATKGRKPTAKRRSREDECINKQNPVTKEVVTKGVKATRQSQKRSIDESIIGECINKQQAVTKDVCALWIGAAPEFWKRYSDSHMDCYDKVAVSKGSIFMSKGSY